MVIVWINTSTAFSFSTSSKKSSSCFIIVSLWFIIACLSYSLSALSHQYLNAPLNPVINNPQACLSVNYLLL